MPTSLLLLLLTQNPYLVEGRQQAQQLHFAEAIEQLKVARQVKSQTSAESREVLELLGRCQVAEGLRTDAVATFAELLKLDPAADLDRKLSPKILEVFDGVKQRMYPPPFVDFVNVLSGRNRAAYSIVDPWRSVAQVVLLSIPSDDSVEQEQALLIVDGQVSIELAVPKNGSVQWWLVARDASGATLKSVGSKENPETFTVLRDHSTFNAGQTLEQEATPRLQRIPAWVAVAVAIGAGIAGGVFQSRSIDRARAARATEWSDSARALQASAVTDAALATGLFIGAGAAGTAGVVLFAW